MARTQWPTESSGIPRVRVLNVIGSMMVGGAESYVARVAPALRPFGVDIDVCILERVGPLIEELEHASIKVLSPASPRQASDTG